MQLHQITKYYANLQASVGLAVTKKIAAAHRSGIKLKQAWDLQSLYRGLHYKKTLSYPLV